jgi:general stress protein YciG
MSNNVHEYLAEIGRKGGAAGRGTSKARTSEQARAAALARWGKRGKTRKAKRSER